MDPKSSKLSFVSSEELETVVPGIKFADKGLSDRTISELMKAVSGCFFPSSTAKDSALKIIGFIQAKLEKVESAKK